MIYIHTKYKENWRTLLIPHPSIPSIPSHPPVNKTFQGKFFFKIRIFHRPFWNLENVLFDWTGWTDGHQKCPLNFFILCGYIDKIYIYLYTKLKLSPTFLWVSKFDVKLGVVIKNFKFTAGRWFFIFWV